MAPRRRTDLAMERLESRTTPSVAAAVDVAGVLSLTWDENDQHTDLTISIVAGEAVVTAPRYHELDVLSDPAGFVVSGDGTAELRLRGVTRLEIDANHQNFIRIPALDVPAAIRFTADAPIIVLGDPDGVAGLAAVSAPVDVRSLRTSDVHITTAELWLMDGYSTASIAFTVEAHSIRATGGFGGVTYAGLDVVRIADQPGSQPDKVVSFDVRSTHGGATVLGSNMFGRSSVVVDAAAEPDDRPEPAEDWIARGRQGRVLSLQNIADVQIRRTNSPVYVNGADEVRITDEGSTANIAHDVTVRGYDYRDVIKTRVLVDDSAGTVAHRATLDAVQPAMYYPYDTVLTGATGGRVTLVRKWGHLEPYFQNNVEYLAPRGLSNTLTIDAQDEWPLPSVPGRFVYHGGSDLASDSVEPVLTLVGTPTNPQWIALSHTSTSPSSGGVRVTNSYWGEQIPPLKISYYGMAGGRIVDLIEAESGSYSWLGGSENATVVRDGDPAEDGVQTLQLSSSNFVTTSIAGKRSISLQLDMPDDPVVRWLIAYYSDTPVFGLDRLTLGFGSPSDVIVAPPGVAVSIGRTAEPETPATVDPNSGGPTTDSDDGGSGPTPEPTVPGGPGSVSTPAPDVPQGTTPTLPETSPNVPAGWLGSTMRTHGSGRRPTPAARLRTDRLAKLAEMRATRAERLLARRDWLLSRSTRTARTA